MINEPEFDPTLEEELRQVKPARMDEALLERINHATTDHSPAPQASTWRSRRWLWLVPFTAAAAIVLALTLSPQKTDNQPDEIAYMELDLKETEPGEQLVRVKVTDLLTGKEAQKEIQFKIVP